MKIRRDKGSSLIYTMVFVTIMIMAGLVAIRFSSLEQRTSSSFRSKQTAFFAAETILLEAERCIREDASCSDITQFDNNCTDGLCFNGSNRTDTASCRTGNQRPWEQAAVWTNSSRHVTATTTPQTVTGSFIIEFLCYVPRNPFGATPNPANSTDWSRLYRITALSSMDDSGARVMLQSTYKW